MRWFYALIAAALVAGAVLAIDRLTGSQRETHTQVVVAAALVIVFVSFVGFLSKLRD